jgi:AcrR family transcriptional regulator
MGIIERRQRQKEEVRTSILNAAWNLVESEGWQALSIRKIADAIEYSIPVIYDHFENKEAIFLEFTKRGFRLLNEDIIKAALISNEPEEQLEAIAYSYWRFAFDNEEYYQLMYGLGLPSCETANQIAELKTFAQLIINPITRLIHKSNNKETDAFLKFQTFWSLLHGLISINMMSKENQRGELNRLVLQDFINGFIFGIKGQQSSKKK